MKKTMLAAVLGALMLTLVPSSAGGSATVTYVAMPGLRISNAAVPVGVGGYQFNTPTKPLTLDVDDVNGNGVWVSVCQENAATEGEIPGNCGGEGDDVDISFCTTGSPRNIGPQNFKPNSPFAVFVLTPGPANGCAQVAVAGTMVVTW